ncbi:MAG: hypothetical protein Ct9H300mP19_18440 [Dehalococcoidia bacterium]|nr:MAG: hypothetical protein Ct9H300mP19_18440 [Dehalococcoidia bacterium]
MGQKTHPIGFRLGGVQDWRAHWFASKASDYGNLTEEDQAIRTLIDGRYAESGAISRVEIERGAQDLVVTINTARPGIIIGRGGTRVDDLRADLEKLTQKRSRLNIQEIRKPGKLDAILVGQAIAEQLERRVAYRRAVRLAMQRTMQSGALGLKLLCRVVLAVRKFPGPINRKKVAPLFIPSGSNRLCSVRSENNFRCNWYKGVDLHWRHDSIC